MGNRNAKTAQGARTNLSQSTTKAIIKTDTPSATGRRPAPALYLIATPIGNLGDITLRALEVLRAADVVLCEDTRVTGKLLRHYDIRAKLQVYNAQSESRDHKWIVDRIAGGAVIAMVSDAGTPLLSDPGYQLVQACVAAKIMVTALPGASAILTALQLSGLPTDAFLFGGFLSTKKSERQTRLRQLVSVPATLIFFERAQRVEDLLDDISSALGARQVAVARELTKLFEDVRRGSIEEIKKSLQDSPIKGEVVVLVDRAHGVQEVSDDDISAALRTRLEGGMAKREAVDAVTETLNLPRRRVYNLAVAIKA